MTKLLSVISPAFYSNLAKCSYLIDSCKQLGLDLHLYGIGEVFTSLFDVKVIQLIPEIIQLDAEYVLVTDSSDAFFLSSEQEIMDKFFKADTPILVSADIQEEYWDAKYPQSIFRDLYPKSITPWRYCNSGGFIGRKKELLKLLSKMTTTKWENYRDCVPVYRYSDWQNDQFIMSCVYIKGYDLKIDTQCELFQTMNLISSDQIKWNTRLTNTVTNTEPCVLHFNGGWQGIDTAFEHRFAKELSVV